MTAEAKCIVQQQHISNDQAAAIVPVDAIPRLSDNYSFRQAEVPGCVIKPYMPQLDGLRAIAVLCIMWHHWAPEQFQTGIPLARAVQLFFVLSGFLITGILIDARVNAERMGGQLTRVLHSFYARRFLRIFPLYYVVLILACFYGVADLPAHWTWHALYASNFCYLMHPGWGTPIGHFWSLAVEEQFYLIWPVLILSMPARALPITLAVTALTGPIYRFVGACYFNCEIWFIGTPGSFDSLALGGILAYALRHPSNIWRTLEKHRFLLFSISMLVFAGVTYNSDSPDWARALDLFVLSVAFCVVVFQAAAGFNGILGSILSNPIMRYIGQLSYGLYVFHNFASIPTRQILYAVPELKLIPGNFLICNFVFTATAAGISWYLLESPFNRLKKHFPYIRTTPTARTSAGQDVLSRS